MKVTFRNENKHQTYILSWSKWYTKLRTAPKITNWSTKQPWTTVYSCCYYAVLLLLLLLPLLLLLLLLLLLR